MNEYSEYCYILDYSDCTICEIELTEEDKNIEPEDLLHKYGCNYNYCSYMFSPTKLNIINLNPKL